MTFKKRRVNPRLEDRVTFNTRARSLLFWICSLGTVSILVLGAVWGGYSLMHWVKKQQRFQVEQITVNGNQRVGWEEVYDLSGIEQGMGIFDVSLFRTAQRLMTHPWIQTANVLRHLPSKIEIQVVERESVVRVLLDELYLVDPDGEVFKKAAGPEGVLLPIVTGIPRDEFVSDGMLAQEKLRQAIAICDSYRMFFGSWDALSEIHYDVIEGWTLMTKDHAQEILLGRGEFKEKLELLSKVAVQVRSSVERVDLVSVLHTGNIVVLPKTGDRKRQNWGGNG